MAAERPVIRNEDDAWKLLKQLCEGERTLPTRGRPVRLSGWPKLKIKIPKPRVKASISSSMMEELVDVQKALLRAYAIAKYDSVDTRHLTDWERESLEFSVVVKGGSSVLDVDYQEVINHVADNLVGKMDSIHIAIVLIVLGLAYFGRDGWVKYLDFRTHKRIDESRSSDIKTQLEALKFLSGQETERAKILAEALSAQPKAGPIIEEAEEVHTALLRGAAKNGGATVQGIALDGTVAEELATNARRSGEDLKMKGAFDILRVDTTHPEGFLVRLRHKGTGETFGAGVQDVFLSEDHRKIIREAEWKKAPISATLDIRRVGGTITKAVITDVTAAPIT